jgi:hypothetical protein
MKKAFYPCCAYDVVEPIKLVQNYVELIVFCDINQRFLRQKEWRPRDASETPISEFVSGDAKTVIHHISPIDFLFYRRDSQGEGGSGLFVLGDEFLRPLMTCFSSSGGHILTDGSNSRGSNFDRMIRKSGLEKFGRRFSTAANQPYLDSHGLWLISVSPQL